MQSQPTARHGQGILVVDDEFVVRDSLCKWFCGEGYMAHCVANACQALEAVEQAPYDLAVIDIQMPGMDGMELQRRLRETHPNLAVIIVTGCPSDYTALQALGMGASAYVTKPVDLDELLHLVAGALERRFEAQPTAPGFQAR